MTKEVLTKELEVNGVMVSSEITQAHQMVVGYYPYSNLVHYQKSPMLFKLYFSSYSADDGVGNNVYITTLPVPDLVKRQDEFNLRAPEGHCPQYCFGASWQFGRLAQEFRLYEETTGFHINRLLGAVSRGTRRSYPGGTEYLVEGMGDNLHFMATTERGTNTIFIPKDLSRFIGYGKVANPSDLEALVDNFGFAFEVR